MSERRMRCDPEEGIYAATVGMHPQADGAWKSASSPIWQVRHPNQKIEWIDKRRRGRQNRRLPESKHEIDVDDTVFEEFRALAGS
jgi:hypothetical protein